MTSIVRRYKTSDYEQLKERGHAEVLVYTPVGNQDLNSRYEQLGFTKGGDYTCYWKGL